MKTFKLVTGICVGPFSKAGVYLRDPYILDFLNLNSRSYQEADLEQGIIINLQQFLLELGKGFAFVERPQRIIQMMATTT